MKKPNFLKRLWIFSKWILMMLIQGISYGIIPAVLLVTKIWIPSIFWTTVLLSMITTSWVAYPFIYIIRKPIRWLRTVPILSTIIVPLWIYLDDSEQYDFGPEWFLKTSNLKTDTWLQRFKASYLWSAVRNPIWNVQNLLLHNKKGGSNYKTIFFKGALLRNYKMVGHWSFAVLKWVDKNGEYSDNKGDSISLKYSILGKMFLWYTVNDKLYFRYSFAGVWKKYWIEVHAGTNDVRFTFRFKMYKKSKINVIE